MPRKRMFIHDYTRPGFYMITILTENRKHLFGGFENDTMVLSAIGETVRKHWYGIPLHRPEIETSDLVIMPDHLHGILYVKEELQKPVGDTIRGFKSGVTSDIRKSKMHSSMQIWADGYHDRIIMNSDTLREERLYISDNPRRYCLRKANPELFTKPRRLDNPILPGNFCWSGFGNLFLLGKPDLFPVQVSRTATQEDVTSLKNKVKDLVARGGVMVSPFISQGEKEIANMVINQDYGSLILLKPDGFAPLYKPSRMYFDLCAKGRLLVLSSFEYSGKRETLTRERCLQMNDWVRGICGKNAATQ